MIQQYPHILKYTTNSGSVQDSEGNWTGGTDTVVQTACRYEPEPRTVFVEAVDGTQVRVTGNVYLPLPAITIQPGTRVEILNGATVLSKETVKRHNAGQLNQRIWL
jgi:hypothetical protein